MLENSWSNKLTQEPKYATIVNLPTPTILYQTSTNQLVAHSRTETSSLPIRKDILGIGALPTGEILLLSRYQLSCFDLINNNEVFSLQFQNAGKLFVQERFIYVVCGSDLFCYNFQGEEQYVNHCSAPIEALTSVQIKDSCEVVVGMNDLTMTRYKGVNISFDYGKILGVPVSIAWIGNGVILGTMEGTVAYYETKKSKWKAKSTHAVFQVRAHRTETEYMAIVARRDGLIELKNWKSTGETISKIKLQEEIVAVFFHDFRQDDNKQIVCVLQSGNIRGINVYEDEKKVEKKKIVGEIDEEEKDIQALQAEKLSLQFQIAKLKEVIAAGAPAQQQSQNVLSKDFNFQTYIHHTEQGFVLEITTINGYISGLSFQEPILPVQFDRSTHVKYAFKAENIVFGEINCFALMHSSYTSKIYEVKGFKITLPKFWKFNAIEEPKNKITGGMKFSYVERNARYIKWISQCFFMRWTQDDKNKLESSNPLKVRFHNAYESIDLEFIFFPKDGKVEIWCDSLKTLGDIFQDFIEYVGGKELDSELWFSKEKDKLKETLATIQRLSQAKVSISSQMADAVDNIKFLLVKGESARCVGSMKDLRRTYTEVMGFNRNLLLQIEKKNLNTKQLSESLKSLGQFINQTANVRYGKAKQQVITACRQAIKKKEFPKILTIMERGSAGI